jgi:hypothetical protein
VKTYLRLLEEIASIDDEARFDLAPERFGPA